MATPTLARNVRLLLISWTGGSLDAMSYLNLGHVFVANMTGNTILLALSLGKQLPALSAYRNLASLCGFLCGAAITAYIVTARIRAKSNSRVTYREKDRDSEWPPEVQQAILLEGAIFLFIALAWTLSDHSNSSALLYFVIVFSAIAMGMQSVSIGHMGVWGVVTTFISGTYTSLMVGFVGAIRDIRLKSPEKNSDRVDKGLSLQASILVIYVLGAVATAVLDPMILRYAPWISASGIFAIIIGGQISKRF